MKKDNLIIASKLLDDFNNFLDKRSAVFLTWSDKTRSTISFLRGGKGPMQRFLQCRQGVKLSLPALGSLKVVQ